MPLSGPRSSSDRAVALSQTPKKGGILHYALTTEPPNYDCHGNTNYGVSQGVFSHYSRLLKDAGDWKESKIVGDVAESWKSRPTAARTRSSSAGA